jgi:hypothetical protein
MRTSIGIGDVVAVIALKGKKFRIEKRLLLSEITNIIGGNLNDAKRGLKLAKIFAFVYEKRGTIYIS